MMIKLKLSQWVLDAPSKRASLYIKDNDENIPIPHILNMPGPIDEVVCFDNDTDEKHFFNVNVVETLPDIVDGDFMVHPMIIRYDSYS